MTAAAAVLQQLQRDLARGTSDLPALPRSVVEALRLARTPNVDFDEVARVASLDPPLAARVVSVANSALYARSGMPKIASVHRAAIRLGAQATRDVLYQVAYASMFVDARRYRDLIEATFEHGVCVGRSSRCLARERGLDQDAAFLGGLLHDIGRARCWKIAAQARRPVDIALVAAAVDSLHAVAGAELAAAWHLPEEVVESCRFHHDAGDREYARVVAAADALAHLDDGTGDAERALSRLVEAGLPPARAKELLPAEARA